MGNKKNKKPNHMASCILNAIMAILMAVFAIRQYVVYTEIDWFAIAMFVFCAIDTFVFWRANKKEKEAQ